MQYVVLAGTLLFVCSYLAGVLSRTSSMPIRQGMVVILSSVVVGLAGCYLNEAPRCHHWLRRMGLGTGDKLDFLSLELLAMAILFVGGTTLIPGWGYVFGRITKRFVHWPPSNAQTRGPT